MQLAPAASKIGFLGLGTMGQGMVANLLTKGFVVTGWNRTRARAQALEHAGMLWADAPAQVAERSDIVFACVADDAAVERVVFGDDGILGLLRADTVVVDCGTTSLGLTARLAFEFDRRGVGFLASPLTGSKLGAQGGSLTLIVGGKAHTLARCRAAFEAVSKYIVHVSEDPTLAQAAKLCLNMTQATVLQGVLEGYMLARTLGVSPEKLFEIFEHSAGRTGVGAFKTPYLFAGDFRPHFRLDLMHKDLLLAKSEADAHEVSLPAAATVLTAFERAVGEGLGGEDFLAIAKVLEHSNPAKPRREPP